jgi:hypothetical protein
VKIARRGEEGGKSPRIHRSDVLEVAMVAMVAIQNKKK